jgi:hypothetical protein
MIDLHLATAFILCLVPVKIIAQCQNDGQYTIFDEGKNRSCKNIRLKEDRRQRLCPVEEVRSMCPQSCGICCADTIGYTFELRNENTQDCDWITRNKVDIRRKDYCVIPQEDNFHFQNGRTIRDACPVACDFCFDFVVADPLTSAPSAGPSASPIRSPSNKPSSSGDSTPSGEPTRPPSPMPSPFPTLRPTNEPSDTPTEVPSDEPSLAPSASPSDQVSALYYVSMFHTVIWHLS